MNEPRVRNHPGLVLISALIAGGKRVITNRLAPDQEGHR
jgi:hypothetical protein